MGYDFTISYKRVKENKVVDILSRVEKHMEGAEVALAMISFHNLNWIEELKNSYMELSEYSTIVSKLMNSSEALNGY